jgi:hypothetical protein
MSDSLKELNEFKKLNGPKRLIALFNHLTF